MFSLIASGASVIPTASTPISILLSVIVVSGGLMLVVMGAMLFVRLRIAERRKDQKPPVPPKSPVKPTGESSGSVMLKQIDVAIDPFEEPSKRSSIAKDEV